MSQNVHKGPDQTLCWVTWSSPWPAFHLPQCFPWEVTLALRKQFPHVAKCTLSPHTPSKHFNYSLLTGSVIFRFPTALPVTPVFHLHLASRLLSLAVLPLKPLTFVFTAVEFSLQWDSISFAAVVRILLPLIYIWPCFSVAIVRICSYKLSGRREVKLVFPSLRWVILERGTKDWRKEGK